MTGSPSGPRSVETASACIRPPVPEHGRAAPGPPARAGSRMVAAVGGDGDGPPRAGTPRRAARPRERGISLAEPILLPQRRRKRRGGHTETQQTRNPEPGDGARRAAEGAGRGSGGSIRCADAPVIPGGPSRTQPVALFIPGGLVAAWWLDSVRHRLSRSYSGPGTGNIGCRRWADPGDPCHRHVPPGRPRRVRRACDRCKQFDTTPRLIVVQEGTGT